jgi:PIN domain nuclease of toxin-antitoxin system
MSAVHDASSLLAVAFREPGGEIARAALRGSLISSVNWSEVIQKIRAKGGSTQDLGTLFAGLGLTIVPFTATTAEVAAGLYPQVKHLGLSLGDRACLALGLETGREVLTANRGWITLSLGVNVRVIR